jgi:hypothetical protein
MKFMKRNARKEEDRSSSDSESTTPFKERLADHARRWKFLLLLLPGFYTASMDLTIVATAQPFIASHFRTSQISFMIPENTNCDQEL